MSKSLRSMSDADKKLAIARRLAGGARGLGYWAAYDARHQPAKETKKEKQDGE